MNTLFDPIDSGYNGLFGGGGGDSGSDYSDDYDNPPDTIQLNGLR